MISVMTFSWCQQNTLNTDSMSTVSSASAVHVLCDCIGGIALRSSQKRNKTPPWYLKLLWLLLPPVKPVPKRVSM
jgi:hypothetical protein